MIITTDNNRLGHEVGEDHYDNCKILAKKKIGYWRSEDHNLLVFPNWQDNGDRIGNEYLFSMVGNKIFTGNIMGFVGLNGSEIKIRSRFDKEGSDYFMHYMLQKVFKLHVLDFEHATERESILDLLLYMFPLFLKRAFRQGLFKEYQSRKYNDANVRGVVDVARHIKMNNPFQGKVAYTTREFSYDNRITQLIRHTIEDIKLHRFGAYILNCDSDIHDCVEQIIAATPSYNRHKRHDVIAQNIKPLIHPYFYEYQALQRLCIQILNREGIRYGHEPNKVYGVLFDGAWLWEEYIHTLVGQFGFIHSENKIGKNPIYLFEDKRYIRYPDFWKDDFVLDAKYKRLSNDIGNEVSSKVNREDMHQLISYMYVLGATNGGFVHPADSADVNAYTEVGTLNGHGGGVHSWALNIPQDCNVFAEYCSRMNDVEIAFQKSLSDRLR